MECMALAEIFATTIFSVKLMHHCIWFYSTDMVGIILTLSTSILIVLHTLYSQKL